MTFYIVIVIPAKLICHCDFVTILAANSIRLAYLLIRLLQGDTSGDYKRMLMGLVRGH